MTAAPAARSKEWQAAREADELRELLSEVLAGSEVSAAVEVHPVMVNLQPSRPLAPAPFYVLRVRWSVPLAGPPLLVSSVGHPGYAPVATGDEAFDREHRLLVAPRVIFDRLFTAPRREMIVVAGLHDLSVERGKLTAWTSGSSDRVAGVGSLKAARDALAALAEGMRELGRAVDLAHRGGAAYRPAVDGPAVAAEWAAWQREVDTLAAALARRPREQIVGFLAVVVLGAGYAFARWLGWA